MSGRRWLAAGLLFCAGVAATLGWASSNSSLAPRSETRDTQALAARRPVDESDSSVRAGVSRKDGALVGRVIDAAGRGISGAQLRVYAEEGTSELTSTTTDAAGAFEAGGLSPGAFRVVVRSAEHRTASVTTALHRRGERRKLLVALEPGRVLRGRVVNFERAPVAGARVGVSDGLAGLATTDADGVFELRGLGGEPVNVYAVAPGYAPARLSGSVPGTTDLELVLEPPAHVEGPLVAPADGERVLVSLCRPAPSSGEAPCVARRLFPKDADHYVLDRLASGDYELVAEVEGHTELRVPVRIRPGERVAGPPLAFR